MINSGTGEGLFRVIHNPLLANDIDLDLSGIFHLVLDLLGNISCEYYHVRIRNLIGYDHDSDFSACLNSKRFFNTLITVGDFFELL